MVKYRIHAGYVTSKSDGDVHWLGAGRLAHLYGISRNEYIIAGSDEEMGIDYRLINLRPLYHGKYKEYLEDISKRSPYRHLFCD